MQFAKFDVTAILVMAPIAIATMMEHVGDMSAISATVGKNFWQNPDFTEHCLEMVLLQLWQAFSRTGQYHLRRKYRRSGTEPCT